MPDDYTPDDYSAHHTTWLASWSRPDATHALYGAHTLKLHHKQCRLIRSAIKAIDTDPNDTHTQRPVSMTTDEAGAWLRLSLKHQRCKVCSHA